MSEDTERSEPRDQDGSGCPDHNRSIRPLTAPEWNGILAETNYTLRVSDGTEEGSWYFWCEQNHEGGHQWLHARRFIWYDDREVGTKELADALEGDVTTQLVVRSRDEDGEASRDRGEVRADGGTTSGATGWSILRDAVMDSDDWEYTLAGHLIGTDWNFPDHGTDTIGKVRESFERQQGHRMDYPEVVLKYSGHRIPVSGFLRRIDPNDIGDVEPAGRVAKRIASLQEERSWRQVHAGIEEKGGDGGGE